MTVWLTQDQWQSRSNCVEVPLCAYYPQCCVRLFLFLPLKIGMTRSAPPLAFLVPFPEDTPQVILAVSQVIPADIQLFLLPTGCRTQNWESSRHPGRWWWLLKCQSGGDAACALLSRNKFIQKSWQSFWCQWADDINTMCLLTTFLNLTVVLSKKRKHLPLSSIINWLILGCFPKYFPLISNMNSLCTFLLNDAMLQYTEWSLPSILERHVFDCPVSDPESSHLKTFWVTVFKAINTLVFQAPT